MKKKFLSIVLSVLALAGPLFGSGISVSAGRRREKSHRCPNSRAHARHRADIQAQIDARNMGGTWERMRAQAQARGQRLGLRRFREALTKYYNIKMMLRHLAVFLIQEFNKDHDMFVGLMRDIEIAEQSIQRVCRKDAFVQINQSCVVRGIRDWIRGAGTEQIIEICQVEGCDNTEDSALVMALYNEDIRLCPFFVASWRAGGIGYHIAVENCDVYTQEYFDSVTAVLSAQSNFLRIVQAGLVDTMRGMGLEQELENFLSDFEYRKYLIGR